MQIDFKYTYLGFKFQLRVQWISHTFFYFLSSFSCVDLHVHHSLLIAVRALTYPSGEHPVKKDSDLAKEDNFPLLYSARMYLSKKSKDSKYNSQGFGAAGLPPLTFSHISRNWRIVPQSKKHQVGFDGAQEMGELYLE